MEPLITVAVVMELLPKVAFVSLFLSSFSLLSRVFLSLVLSVSNVNRAAVSETSPLSQSLGSGHQQNQPDRFVQVATWSSEQVQWSVTTSTYTSCPTQTLS